MVSVPVTFRNTVEPQPLGNERLRYSAPRNFLGPALVRAGDAIGAAAQDWDAIEATYDEADATRIANEYGNYERERLRTGDNAYLTTEGFDAGNGREAAVQDLRTGAENLLTGARSQRARAMAQRALDVKLGNAEDLVAAHAVQQMTVARNEQSQARIDGAITDAIDARGTDQFVVNLGVARQELAQLSQRHGWSAEQAKDEDAKLVSNAYSRTVLAIDAEDGEPTRALQFLDQSKGLIRPDEEAKLRDSLAPRVDAAWARNEINGIVDSYVAAPEAAAAGSVMGYQVVSNPDKSTWDKRADGSDKGMGWLGLLKRPDGGVSSEISVGIEIGGKEQEAPLMVPGLSKRELDYLMTHDPEADDFQRNMPKSILRKAEDHARQRISEGKSPFRQDGEAVGETNQAAEVAGDPLRGQGHVVQGGQFGAHRSYGGHTGIDYAAPPGTAVHPTGSGVVKRAYFDRAYGNRVEIDHGNGIVTTYSHMQSLAVHEGEQVTPDMVLGGVGDTGSASHGNHVHYETIHNGVKVNPSSLPAGAPGIPADPRLNSQNVQNAVEAYIAAHPEIPERRAEALRAAGDHYVANARADRAQAEQDADRRVMDWLTRNKPGADDLSDMGQIPTAILSGASPPTVAAIQDRVQATRNRQQARQDAAAKKAADDAETAAVFELYTKTDAELAKTDLRQYAGRIGLDKLGPWIDRQQQVANTAAGNPVSADRIAAKIDSIGKPYGASRAPDASADEKKAWIALRGYVERRTAGRNNKDVSDEDLRGIVAAGMSEVEVEGTGWLRNDRLPLAQVPEGAQFHSVMSHANREQIKSNLRPLLGREPSEKEVWEAYQSLKARGLMQ